MPIISILLANASIQCKTEEEARKLMQHPEKLLMKGSWAVPYLQLARKEQKSPEQFWEDYSNKGTIGLKDYKDLLLSSNQKKKNWAVKRKSKSHFKKY